MSEQQQQGQPTEEELRAAYEEQLKRIRVDDVLVQTVLSLINLGSLRAGLVPGSEDAAQIRDAVSRLQMEYARLAGAGAAETPEQQPEAPKGEEQQSQNKPEGPGPAESSGRLWVPGR